MKKINWGIIGAGNIAGAMAKALSHNSDVANCAIAARSLEKAKSFAQQWKVSKAYGSYEELLTAPDIDVVYIATPHVNHAELSITAMKNGKSVLCEKPACVNASDFKKIMQVSKKTGCFFMEAMWTKFHPAFNQAMKWIEEGKIGFLKQIHADFAGNMTYVKGSRVYEKELAGGALLDVGIYPVTAAVCAIRCASSYAKKQGKKDALKAIEHPAPYKIASSVRMGETGVDYYNSMSLTFDIAGTDVIAHLSSGIDVACGELMRSAWFIGSEGVIHMNDFFMAQSVELYNTQSKKIEDISYPFDVNGYEYEVREVNACIAQKKAGLNPDCIESGVHSHADTFNVLTILDTLRKDWGLVYPFEKRSVQETDTETDADTGDGIIIYTDGACSGNPGKGGWGAVLLANGKELWLSGGEAKTTNNRMELCGAIFALKELEKLSIDSSRSITLYIDSQYVKNGITSWIESWKKNGWKTAAKEPVKNQDLWLMLDELNKKYSVEWKWVKGHAGNKYNEICDELARNAQV